METLADTNSSHIGADSLNLPSSAHLWVLLNQRNQ